MDSDTSGPLFHPDGSPVLPSPEELVAELLRWEAQSPEEEMAEIILGRDLLPSDEGFIAACREAMRRTGQGVFAIETIDELNSIVHGLEEGGDAWR